MESKHKYNKQFILKEIRKKSGVKQYIVDDVLEAFKETIFDAMIQGEEFRLKEFGVFKPWHKEARTRRNPKTGEIVEVEESKSMKFLASEYFANRINQEFKKSQK